MYQSETAPRQLRGAIVSCYQLFITLGIFVAYCVNFGTGADQSRRSWRIPMGVGFIWPGIMMSGMVILPASPRWDYRHGHINRAKSTISKSYGVPENHRIVERELKDIREKLEAESAGGKQKAIEIFTGPRMKYRLLLGAGLQALQRLTGMYQNLDAPPLKYYEVITNMERRQLLFLLWYLNIHCHWTKH